MAEQLDAEARAKLRDFVEEFKDLEGEKITVIKSALTALISPKCP